MHRCGQAARSQQTCIWQRTSDLQHHWPTCILSSTWSYIAALHTMPYSYPYCALEAVKRSLGFCAVPAEPAEPAASSQGLVSPFQITHRQGSPLRKYVWRQYWRSLLSGGVFAILSGDKIQKPVQHLLLTIETGPSNLRESVLGLRSPLLFASRVPTRAVNNHEHLPQPQLRRGR